MTDNKVLTEMRARKAKFGFKLDYLYPKMFVPLGKLIESLDDNKFVYLADMVGMHGTDFRLYTDDDRAAEFIRANFCIKV